MSDEYEIFEVGGKLYRARREAPSGPAGPSEAAGRVPTPIEPQRAPSDPGKAPAKGELKFLRRFGL